MIVLASLLATGLAGLFLMAPNAVASEVHIDPGSGFTQTQADEIRELVREAKMPTEVFALDDLPAAARESAYLHGQHLAAATPGPPGLILVYSPDAIPAYAMVDRTGSRYGSLMMLTSVQNLEGTDRDRFVALVEVATTWTGKESLHDAAVRAQGERKAASRTAREPTNDIRTVRRVFLAGGVVLLLIVLAARARAVSGWFRRRRRSDGLEGTAAAATSVNFADQARADLLDFGAALDGQPMRESDALEVWGLRSTTMTRQRGSSTAGAAIGTTRRSLSCVPVVRSGWRRSRPPDWGLCWSAGRLPG